MMGREQANTNPTLSGRARWTEHGGQRGLRAIDSDLVAVAFRYPGKSAGREQANTPDPPLLPHWLTGILVQKDNLRQVYFIIPITERI